MKRVITFTPAMKLIAILNKSVADSAIQEMNATKKAPKATVKRRARKTV